MEVEDTELVVAKKYYPWIGLL